MTDNNQYNDIDHLLAGLFRPETDLDELFEQRIIDLKLSQRSALTELDMELRTLRGILNGTVKNVDLLALSRLANFLQIPFEKAVSSLFKRLEISYKDEIELYRIREFIINNFDLNTLQKIGFLTSTTDFKYINERLTTYFGYDSIFEYDSEKFGFALSSSTKRKPKDKLTKNFWLKWARKNLLKINNYFEYDRAKLIDYIPTIRWHSMNAKKGLYQAIRDLFKLGITVIFEPYIDNIYVRGATFSVNDKPAIVLTNYTKHYPTLWFALLHEIHHVLYDWEAIHTESYHVSGELDLFTKEEVDADAFARECLVTSTMMDYVKPYIGNETFVKEYAKANYIHPSIIYVFYCWDNQDNDKKVWGRFNELIPNLNEAIGALNGNPWQNRKSIREITQQRQDEVFNGL